MNLALRKTNANGIGALFSLYTRWTLKTQYPHAGIEKDGLMYHIESKGLKCETFKKEDWDLFPIQNKLDVVAEYNNLKHSLNYDFFSLLGFKLPFLFRSKSTMYCYEWCWYIMKGESPIKPITPELLITESLK